MPEASFEAWFAAYLASGGTKHFNITADKESAHAAWCAAKEVPPDTGMVLVPEKLTEAMHAAAVRTIVRCNGNDDWPPRVWQAMLSAAKAEQA